ncbi:MAG TPA: glycosyltransferase [Kofleriaceae bacterium]|nr:glycosyltransferase [Kofleriaceae bacterium]
MPPLRLLVFRPDLSQGGADRVTITLLHHFDRTRFTPTLALVKKRGELLGEVPADVPIVDLGAKRLARAAPALTRAIRELEPDVVLCTAGGANVIAVAAHQLARSRARLVLSERNAVGRDVGRVRSALERAAKAAMYRLADEITAVSDGVAQDLIRQLRLPRERVRVVYNPVVHRGLAPLAREPVQHPWFETPGSTLLAVGRLTAQKGYPTMLAAFVQIRAKVRDARLAILGDGPDREELERHARELGLDNAVAFLGFDPNPFRYMARARLLVQSSLAEGLPGTIIQSMACGTPVVATDCDHGPREVIRNDVNGYLVPVGDAGALARHAIDVMTTPELRARLGAAARDSAQRFTVESSMRHYEAALMGGAHTPTETRTTG